MNNGEKPKKTDFLKIFGYSCGGCAGVFLMIILFFSFLSNLGSNIKTPPNNSKKSTKEVPAAQPKETGKNEIEEHNKKVLEEAMSKEKEIQRKEKREAILRERKAKAEKVIAREVEANKEQEAIDKLPVEEKIETIVRKSLPENNEDGKKFIRKIEILKQFDGSWGVSVEFNASNKAIYQKESIQKEMSRIYQAIYTSGYKIGQASAGSYLEVVDKYGNEGEEMVYKTILEGANGNKINWKYNDEDYLLTKIIPGVWDHSFIYPFLEK